MEKQQRIVIVDSVKGLSILAVMLYHFWAILPYGYLGVDIFFVISGYFMARGLMRQFENNTFKYFNYVIKKAVRLLPLILIVLLISLIVGFFVMLPDDYENLSESVVASSVFANNVLQCITTKNYWNIVNTYKPLMDLWYVGVLMQAYVFIPLIYLIFVKTINNTRKGMAIGTVILTAVSLALYLIPSFSAAEKFYYLPFRMFEITVGCGVYIIGNVFPPSPRKILRSWFGNNVILLIIMAVMLVMLFTQLCIISPKAMLLITVALAAAFMYFQTEFTPKRLPILTRLQNVLAEIGKCSYSIYIWHQFIIAFIFYFVFEKPNAISFVLFIVITFILTFLSRRFVEMPIEKRIIDSKQCHILFGGSCLCSVLICVISLTVYMRAGVIRDVPELNIYTNNVHRNMHAEYCDIPYSWDKDFSQEGKFHVLVVGNSFGRDWANILHEWDQDEKLEISYCADINNKGTRVSASDYVFYASGPGYGDIPRQVIDEVPNEKLYIIGNKSYGISNGIIYAKRNRADYYSQTVDVERELSDHNNELKSRFGTHYIDLLEPIMQSDGEINVFTDDRKYISQDCKHLTKSGAQYYARIIPFSQFFSDDFHQ